MSRPHAEREAQAAAREGGDRPAETEGPAAARTGGAPPAGVGERAARVTAWLRPHLRGLEPYYQAPLDGDPLRLDQNTNLHDTNPALGEVDPLALHAVDYPTRDADALTAALADRHGLDPGNFLAANGSDEALDILTKAFTGPRDILATPRPSYSLYPFYATLHDLRLETVPLRGGWRLDTEAVLAVRPAMIVVASPNNPTGNRFPTGELERLVADADCPVVIDEAYIEYAGQRHSMAPHVEAHDNLIVMRTFSKAYGLAALRIGYLVANQELMARLRTVKPPYNLNAFSEQVAVRALAHQEWVDAAVGAVEDERPRMEDMLRRAGLRPFPSDANFILCRSPVPPGQLVAGLRQHGILARHFPGKAMLDECVRFTVGRPEHTARLQTALEEILA